MPVKKQKAMETKILVCVNDKDHSITALRFACTKAKKVKASVELLYVVDPVDYNTIFSVADVIKEDRLAEGEALMERLVQEAEKWAKITPDCHIREGLIKEEVMHHVEADNSINLLILGVAADGSSNKGRLLSQLTTEIGCSYHIPLMIIPGNLTDQQIKELN